MYLLNLSNFTVDESLEARNRGVSRSPAKQVVFHRGWRTSGGMRCIYHGGAASPETWGKHLSFATRTGRASSPCQSSKRGGGVGKWTERGEEEDRGFERRERMAFIFSLRQSKQPLPGNPSALPHCSSLWAATKGGNAGKRGGKREWAEHMNFVGSSSCAALSPLSPFVEEGLGLVSRRVYESSIARSSNGELLFRMRKKRKEENLFNDPFRVIVRSRFPFLKRMSRNPSKEKLRDRWIKGRKIHTWSTYKGTLRNLCWVLRLKLMILDDRKRFFFQYSSSFFLSLPPDFCIVLR